MTPATALKSDALAAFGVFARHLNFTRAAAELHIAQPSLHTKVAKLSRALGVSLYERAGRGLYLTREGEALAAFAADQERVVDDFLAGLTQSTNQLRIAAGRAAIQWVLERQLGDLAREGVALHVTPANRADALALVQSGGADVAAIAYDPPPRHLCSAPIQELPQLLVAHESDPIASQASCTLEDLEGRAMVVPAEGRPHRQSLERALDAAGVRWTVASEADGWDLIVHLTGLGVGVSVVNGCVPIPSPLVGVEVQDLPRVGYWLVWRAQRQAIVDPLLRAVSGDA